MHGEIGRGKTAKLLNYIVIKKIEKIMNVLCIHLRYLGKTDTKKGGQVCCLVIHQEQRPLV